VTLAPEWAAAHHNLGVALSRQGRAAEAIDAFRQAIAHGPRTPTVAQSHVCLGLLLLERGDYLAGWQEMEWRFADRGGSRAALGGRPQPLWRGEPLTGRTLLLGAEQGCGAMMQFVRFAPRLAALGARILLEAPASLAGLLSTCPGVAAVVALDAPCPDADLQLPLQSVPRVLGTTLETLPADIPYLSAPRRPRPDLATALAPYRRRLKVGIAWSGNRHYPLNADRSCLPADFATLAQLPGVQLFSLQQDDEGATEAELEALGIRSLAPLLGDFASTAAVVSRLDLVLTVDTCTAHLAGALGRPVWTLLHQPCDWRWGAAGGTTPWYPGMRLLRQERPGDWRGVFRAVRAALAERMPLPTAGPPPACGWAARSW
jgi:hypothetical protein